MMKKAFDGDLSLSLSLYIYIYMFAGLDNCQVTDHKDIEARESGGQRLKEKTR